MLQFVLNSLFGCSHQRTTFPLTPVKRSTGATVPGAVRFGMYVTCLDCGKELAYDWDEMRIGGPALPRQAAAETHPAFAETQSGNR